MEYIKDTVLTYLKNNILLFILLIINLVGFAYLSFFNNSNDLEYEEDIVGEISVVDDNNESKSVLVDVKGSVKKPGVYVLDGDSVVNDAIKAAGGVNNKGTLDLINLSMKVSNEMVIYVATKNEVSKIKSIEVVNEEEKTVTKIDSMPIKNDALINNDEVVGLVEDIKDNTSKSDFSNQLININSSDINNLTKIPSIGEAKAKKIIEYREENGLFKSVEEIKNVSGIGESLYEKIKDYIKI